MFRAARLEEAPTWLEAPNENIAPYGVKEPALRSSSTPNEQKTNTTAAIRSRIEIQQPPASLADTTESTRAGDEYFKPIKNWEGVVESIGATTFVAAMREADNPSDHGNEQFEIEIEDVDSGDMDLLKLGAIFYFTVGYRIKRGGTRIKGMQMVFRRMPLWSKRDIERVMTRADQLLKIMGGEDLLGRDSRA